MCQGKYGNNRFCEQWLCEYILAHNAYSLEECRKGDIYSQPEVFWMLSNKTGTSKEFKLEN